MDKFDLKLKTQKSEAEPKKLEVEVTEQGSAIEVKLGDMLVLMLCNNGDGTVWVNDLRSLGFDMTVVGQ